jgi:hypothetical protein
MKVAIVLTGHMRCWKQVYPNFKQRLVERYDPDIFIETWEDEAYWDPHSQHGIVKDAPKVNFDDLRNTYRPIAMRFDSYEKYQTSFEERSKQYSNFYHVPKNIISMLFKLGRGILMLEDYMFLTGKTYDLVIRMRPDLVFNEPLPEFDPNKFYTLGYRNHMGQGTSDMIQVGNFFTISLFSKLLHHLPQIYRETGLLCPHVVSEHFIRRLGFPWEEFMIDKTIMHTPLGEYKRKEMYLK